MGPIAPESSFGEFRKPFRRMDPSLTSFAFGDRFVATWSNVCTSLRTVPSACCVHGLQHVTLPTALSGPVSLFIHPPSCSMYQLSPRYRSHSFASGKCLQTRRQDPFGEKLRDVCSGGSDPSTQSAPSIHGPRVWNDCPSFRLTRLPERKQTESGQFSSRKILSACSRWVSPRVGF